MKPFCSQCHYLCRKVDEPQQSVILRNPVCIHPNNLIKTEETWYKEVYITKDTPQDINWYNKCKWFKRMPPVGNAVI
jgi:hypothetical protein